MPPRIQYAVLYLAFIVSAYFLRFTRLALVLLVIHYISEAIFHVCRLLAYSEKTSISNKLFKFGDLVFVLARLSSVILSVLTFWFGLAKLPAEQQVFDLETGNFNTGLIRLNSLIAVCLLQAFLMWNFIVCQVKTKINTPTNPIRTYMPSPSCLSWGMQYIFPYEIWNIL